MSKTEEFDKQLKGAGFNKAERDTIKIISQEAGLKFVDMDSLKIIQAESASQRDGYWADGIGGTWERDAPIFELFYKANFRKFKEIEL